MTKPCSPFLATEPNQLLLSDPVQTVLTLSYSREENIKAGLTMSLKTKETVRQAKNGDGNDRNRERESCLCDTVHLASSHPDGLLRLPIRNKAARPDLSSWDDVCSRDRRGCRLRCARPGVGALRDSARRAGHSVFVCLADLPLSTSYFSPGLPPPPSPSSTSP